MGSYGTAIAFHGAAMESDGTAIEKNVGSELTASDRHVIPCCRDGAAIGPHGIAVGGVWGRCEIVV